MPIVVRSWQAKPAHAVAGKDLSRLSKGGNCQEWLGCLAQMLPPVPLPERLKPLASFQSEYAGDMTSSPLLASKLLM